MARAKRLRKWRFKEGPLKGTILGVAGDVDTYTHTAKDGATYTYNREGVVTSSTPAPAPTPAPVPAGNGSAGLTEADKEKAASAVDALTKVCMAIGFDPRELTQEELTAKLAETGTLIGNLSVVAKQLLNLLRKVVLGKDLPKDATKELRALGKRLEALEGGGGA